jgi:hypothetical protein
MIGATFVSSRVQSAASWSKRPPSFCCRWRSPDVQWPRRRIWHRTHPSSLRASRGMVLARIQTGPNVLERPRALRTTRSGPIGFGMASTSTGMLFLAVRSSFATAACVHSPAKTRGSPKHRTEPTGSRFGLPGRVSFRATSRAKIVFRAAGTKAGALRSRTPPLAASFSYNCHTPFKRAPLLGCKLRGRLMIY